VSPLACRVSSESALEGGGAPEPFRRDRAPADRCGQQKTTRSLPYEAAATIHLPGHACACAWACAYARACAWCAGTFENGADTPGAGACRGCGTDDDKCARSRSESVSASDPLPAPPLSTETPSMVRHAGFRTFSVETLLASEAPPLAPAPPPGAPAAEEAACQASSP